MTLKNISSNNVGPTGGLKNLPAVVLIDPFSTGVMLQERLFGAGYRIILVWSDRSHPEERAKHYIRSGRGQEEFAAIVIHENLNKTLLDIMTVGADLAAVMCGSEVGVLLEDVLADNLALLTGANHLRSSGMANPRLKVDKYMQAETVHAAGLPVAYQKLAHSKEDIRAFLDHHRGREFKVVVKPQTGAGSVGVTFCDSEEAVWKAYDTILAGEHSAHCSANRHYHCAGVLLQDFMEGTEYIVNAVMRDGVFKCTAMWKYDKRPYNGAAFVCYGKELLSVGDEPQLPEILVYTERVLEAFQFRNGAVHAEIMYTEEGPRLVEINCRLHGGNGAWVRPAEQCMAYSQLSVYMDVYLTGGKVLFDYISRWPKDVVGGCYQVKMRSHVTGTLETVIKPQLDRILALPSYQEHFISTRPGEKLLLTVDMPSVPGEVTLVHQNKDVLKADYHELNDILHEGIFNVSPEHGPDSARLFVPLQANELLTVNKFNVKVIE